MEYLKRIPGLCKKHYEKLIVILALLVLGAVVMVLNTLRQQEAEKLGEFERGLDRKATKLMASQVPKNLDTVLQSAAKPLALDLGLPHHLFNPVKWQIRTADGQKIKIATGAEVGPSMMVITKITELPFALFLDRVANAGGYYIGYSNAAAALPALRYKRQRFATLNSTNEVFALVEIKGALEEPSELVLELVPSRERVAISKDKAYVRVDGYEANLKYPVEGRTFNNQRAGQEISFGGDTYKIVDITATEVVLSATSNNKEYRVRRIEPQ